MPTLMVLEILISLLKAAKMSQVWLELLVIVMTRILLLILMPLKPVMSWTIIVMEL